MATAPSLTSPNVQPRRLAFIGLGVMGAPMAGHLVRAGHHVVAYNRSPEKASAWLVSLDTTGTGVGKVAASPQQAVHGAEMVFSCVGNDDDLRSVTLGQPDASGHRHNGAFDVLERGAIWVDHTTTSALVAQELHNIASQRGLQFVDAPVSGGNLGAIKGALTVLCGGQEAAVEAIRPVLKAYSKAITHIGASGAGQRAKMVNQICIAGLLQGLAEAIAFGEKAGLDMTRVLGAISQGAAQSWQLENRGPTMIEDRFDFGFAVDWMRKDLGLVINEAQQNGASLPVTELVRHFYDKLSAQGGGRWDTSSLIKRLR